MPENKVPSSKKIRTQVTRLGRDPQSFHGAVNPPIYQTSTVIFPSLKAFQKDGGAPLGYGRRATPTTLALQEAITTLEGGHNTALTPSGLSAITCAILAYVQAGDHILVAESVYDPTRAFCDHFLARFGISVTYVDARSRAGLSRLLTPQTRLLFLESPASQTFEIQDIAPLARAAHKAGLVVLMDNTWATPYFFKPLAHGVDVSIQSATKYLSGHADCILGSICTTQPHWRALARTHRLLGLKVGPHETSLTLRGLRTLSVRLEQHYANALRLARWLKKQPQIAHVLYPALPQSPDYRLWKKYFSGAASLVSIILHPHKPASLAHMLDNMAYFHLGYSWGGFESLILPIAPERQFWHVPKGQMLRLHVGLEDIKDLQDDMAAGLARLRPN